jgi:hypothetical protein
MKFATGILVGLCIVGATGIRPVHKVVGQGETDALAGEHFWSFSNTVDDTRVSGMLRLGVMKVTDDHYLCSGVFTFTDPMPFEFTTFGNMERLETEVRVTLCVQGIRCVDGSCTVGIDMMTITMDPNTLSGPSEGIGVYHGATEHSVGEVVYLGREVPEDGTP